MKERRLTQDEEFFLAHGEEAVRSVVLGLQTTGLKATEQLDRLKVLQSEYSEKLTPPARYYLDSEVTALEDFCR